MTPQPLKYLSEAKLIELRESVDQNLARYSTGSFADRLGENGWSIDASGMAVDVGALGELRGGVEADVENAIRLHRALRGMTPAVAREERVWVRLTHVECLPYVRGRWLEGRDGDALKKAVLLHVFAPGLTGIRDDNALARLWWSMHIAGLADPEDPEGALRLILKRADIRMQFVERSGTAARPPLARAIVRAMRRDAWLTSTEASFRKFMIALNRDGGGVLFEALGDGDADRLMERCAARARQMGEERRQA